MKSVGVKQLKSRLSEYLRLVRGGETVLVTDRDEVVAELRPTRKQPGIADSLDEILDSLAERGEVTRATLPKRRWKWKATGLGLAAGYRGYGRGALTAAGQTRQHIECCSRRTETAQHRIKADRADRLGAAQAQPIEALLRIEFACGQRLSQPLGCLSL